MCPLPSWTYNLESNTSSHQQIFIPQSIGQRWLGIGGAFEEKREIKWRTVSPDTCRFYLYSPPPSPVQNWPTMFVRQAEPQPTQLCLLEIVGLCRSGGYNDIDPLENGYEAPLLPNLNQFPLTDTTHNGSVGPYLCGPSGSARLSDCLVRPWVFGWFSRFVICHRLWILSNAFPIVSWFLIPWQSLRDLYGVQKV